ncbi:MAG: MipA/OmpV family protein [Mariprofundaceae bacterium]
MRLSTTIVTIQHNRKIAVAVQIASYFSQGQGEKAELTPVSEHLVIGKISGELNSYQQSRIKTYASNTDMIVKLLITTCFLLSLSTICLAEDVKKELPLWELGIAAGAFSVPHYVGSDQRYTVPLAAPYIVYRGDIIRADRDGLRGRLFNSKGLSLDIDFSFGLPVKSTNKARSGMPDLKLTGQVGPQLNIQLEKSQQSQLSLHLPYRFAMDISRTYVGWVTEPSIRYERYDLSSQLKKISLRLEAGLLYASRRYNQTYYGVEPIYAKTGRPSYQAKRGLHSYFIDTSLRYKVDKDLTLSGMLRMRTLAGAVNRHSPLVRQNYYLSAGIGLVWTFVYSDEMVWR